MNPSALPEDFRRSLTAWARRPPVISPSGARRRVVERLRPAVSPPRTRLLAAAAAAVTLAGVWLAARADRVHQPAPGLATSPIAAPAAAPMVVMRLSSGTTLYVTLPTKP